MKNPLVTGLLNVYLRPGEIYVSQVPTLVSTVLGSCVSVILYSPTLAKGAICHAMLPSGTNENGFRYVDTAVTVMYERLRNISKQSLDFQVKLFGGANMLNTGNGSTGPMTVGQQNVEAALQAIKALGLTLVASDTGGDRGRKIFFNSTTGEVLMRPVRKTM